MKRGFTRRAFLATTGSLAAAGIGASQLPQEIGAPRRKYGERSPFEKSERLIRNSLTPGTGASRTQLQDLYGILTPSSLHFERHHSSVPLIDPQRHELLVHGLVERPLVFGMSDILRFPSVSRIHFIECAGNTGGEQAGPPAADPQKSHGLMSCSEWTCTAGRRAEQDSSCRGSPENECKLACC